MKLTTVRSAVLSSLFALQTLAKIIPAASKRDDDSNSKFVKLPFHKLYGDTRDDVGTDKKPEVRLLKRADGYEEIIITNQQSFYSVDLEVGTPPQNVTVLVDTGSSDLWIMGSNNPYCSSGSMSSSRRRVINKRDDSSSSGALVNDINPFGWLTGTGSAIGPTATGSGGGSGTATQSVPASEATMNCQEFGTFTTSDSSTFRSNNTYFSISYGDGTFASGTFGTDILDLSDLNVTGLSFAVANETNSTMGVLGIGLPELEVTYSGSTASSSRRPYTYDNFPMVLKNSGAIKTNAYSLYLNDSDAKHGTILFGAVDHSKYAGTLYTVPIVNTLSASGFSSPIQFDVTINGIGISYPDNSQKTLTTTQIPALLDSGTTLTYLPQAVVAMIADELDAQYSSRLGYYVLDCPSNSNSTQIVFDFGGFHINASLSSFILNAGNICLLGIIATDDTTILGDSFLTNAYVVYDLDNLEISMAQAQYNITNENIEVITSSIPSAIKAPGYTSTWSTSASIVTGGNIFTVDSSQTASFSGNVTSATASATSTTSKSRNVGDRMAPSLPFTLITLLFAFI
ncbi:aspartyl protease SKDI_12G1680 [Saccharomyces kudriavzevii IFO 1802]|uniref:Peptidase A1 domain-containing protein n=1 Tax=Saccharomyces kudriavzevii (strain ATCC MYA-4449 / AS 2.2408 / CBS 8840 / NBRC 1802 / NCYC 2889) TaxID=226230 RepID=A0AA35NJN6_SACK1|nr:uncharacterized protein SKDI_12G1680 [Saccharomyces kudriavzevii IFO 1802]CAI4046102.1 hypothetical protein SKDI_12G1680 [Saccharomyces kudriavzevii IFO 1802]